MSSRAKIRRTEDWVDLLQRIYSLDGDEQAWLENLLEGPSAEAWGDGTAAFTFDVKPSAILLRDVDVRGEPSLRTRIYNLASNSSADAMDWVFRNGKIVATLREHVWSRYSEHEAVFRRVTAGPPDVFGIIAHSGDGRGVVLNLPLAAPRNSTAGERRRWRRGAAHVGAALPQTRGTRNHSGSHAGEKPSGKSAQGCNRRPLARCSHRQQRNLVPGRI